MKYFCSFPKLKRFIGVKGYDFRDQTQVSSIADQFLTIWATSSVQSLSRVQPFVTPWTAARQASLSVTDSQSPPKPMSVESVMLLYCGAGEDPWVPWTAGRSNQSILREINLEYSLEGLMMKLKLKYFAHLMWRADSLE